MTFEWQGMNVVGWLGLVVVIIYLLVIVLKPVRSIIVKEDGGLFRLYPLILIMLICVAGIIIQWCRGKGVAEFIKEVLIYIGIGTALLLGAPLLPAVYPLMQWLRHKRAAAPRK